VSNRLSFGRKVRFIDTLPTILKPRSGGATVLRHHQASAITIAIGHITDNNSPVVDSDAITDLQVAARGALNLPNLLPLHHPRHCCLNSTTSIRPPLPDHTVIESKKGDTDGAISSYELVVQCLRKYKEDFDMAGDGAGKSNNSPHMCHLVCNRTDWFA